MRVKCSVTVRDDYSNVRYFGTCAVVRGEQFGPHSIQSVVEISPTHSGRKFGIRVDCVDQTRRVRVADQVPANYRPIAERQQTHLKQNKTT